MRITKKTVILLLWTMPLWAAEAPVVLTLEDAVNLALEKGYDARVDQLNLLRAEQNVKAARGRFRTRVNMIFFAPDFSENVSSVQVPDQLPIYNTFGTMRWQNQLSITQPLPTDGSISLHSNLYQVRESVFRDELDYTDKNKRFFSSFRLEFRQPLFVPNSLKLGVERANLNHEQAQREYTRTRLDVVYRVTQVFFNLYRAIRSLEIAQAEVRQQEDSYDLARKKYEAGLIPEVEALQMEVDLARSRNDLLEAEGNLARRKDNFKLTVGLPLEEDVAVKTDFALNLFGVDEEKAIAHGLRHRAEIRQAEIDSRIAEITLAETDARSAIKGEITAYYDLTGVSDPNLDYSTSTSSLISSSFTDMRRRPRNHGVRFMITLPIWDSGVNRAEVASARALLDRRELSEQEQERTVIQQIRSVISTLRETRGRLDVLKKSEEVALRGYEISRSRFDNGDITSQDLALDRDRLTRARQDYLNAYISYQLSVADLKRNTLYDWEKGRSLAGAAG